MHLRYPTDHEFSEIGHALVSVNDQLSMIERNCSREFLLLYLERHPDQPGESVWFCSLGGRPLGVNGLHLPDLYERLAEAAPLPEDWDPLHEDEYLNEAVTAIQVATAAWNDITRQANIVIIRAQAGSNDPRLVLRFVNGKTLPPENDDQSDLDLITTLIGIDVTQPIS